jgi:hypothetical protein
MDPQFMKEVNERYGPLEWRLPEAHAIYWAAMGLKKAAENPSKVKPEDLITLRRAVYQSMQMSFHRGRLVANPFVKAFEFGPNLDIVPKVSAAYEEAADEDKPNRDHIQKAHRNFLRDAVYFLYVNNRIADAAKWYKYLGEKYPNVHVIEGDTNSLPSKVSLDRYAVSKVEEDISETSRDRVKSALEGLLVNAFMSLVVDEDQRAAGFKLLAGKIWQTYMDQIAKERIDAIGFRPLKEMEQEVLARLLDPGEGADPEIRAVLRTKLGMPAEPPQPTPAPASGASTNAPPQAASSK